MSDPHSASDDSLFINERLRIPRGELVVSATRSSGAGGQHVNKTASRVEISWNAAVSPALSDADRDTLLRRLSRRISRAGELRVVASDTRSQHRNREIAEERLARVVREALVLPKQRRPTKPSRAARAARLDAKRRRSETKQRRRPDDAE